MLVPINIPSIRNPSSRLDKILDLLSQYCCVGFLYAETANGFFIFPFGNVGSLNLTSINGGTAYYASGWMLYQDQANAYAFLIPRDLTHMNATLANIEKMPSTMTVDSEANLISLRDNTIFVGLTFVLIAFSVPALQRYSLIFSPTRRLSKQPMKQVISPPITRAKLIKENRLEKSKPKLPVVRP